MKKRLKYKLKNFLFQNFPKVFSQTMAFKFWRRDSESIASFFEIEGAENIINCFPTHDYFEPPPASTPISDVVDIIVPVYGNLFVTKRCIESVLANLVYINCKCRVIVIDDCSPNLEITEYFSQLPSEVTVIRNPRNLGFTATVNIGMRLSDLNDVILLNSDAEVANNWIDRLRAQAYRDSRVSSVTPFSNNATICSYPNNDGLKNNPFSMTTSQIDDSFCEANLGKSIEIPTAVGFCMYIRRDSLM